MTFFNAPPPAKVSVPKAFFVTPLSDDRAYRDRVFAVVGDVCSRLGLVCERDVELRAAQPFTDTILSGITWATVVICDLSLARPNCYYELGIAQMLGRPVCLIAKEGTEIHADVRQFQVLYYKDLKDLKRKLPGSVLDSAFKSLPPHAPKDALRGAFGGLALVNDYLLSGWVTPLHKVRPERWFDLSLRVESVDSKRPLTGAVTFFLDAELTPARRTVTARNGVAMLEDTSIYGAFTVGATVHGASRKRGQGDGTQLELNLMRVPGSNPSFRFM